RDEQEGRDRDGRAPARGSAGRAAQRCGRAGRRRAPRPAPSAPRALRRVAGDRRARARLGRAAGSPAREAVHVGRAVADGGAPTLIGGSRTEERELWGGEPAKAVANFPVSGEPIPAPVARWLGRIKGAAARVNAELGLLDADKAERIADAADRIARGEL